MHGAGAVVARVNTVAFQGIEVLNIDVQVQMTGGMPAFSLVGLPDKAVGESRERVRSALYALGLALPPKRITVNMAPADVLKEGSHFDLPIALGLMAALGARFLDADGEPVRCAGGHLGRIARIDLADLDDRLRDLRITIASDVESPLLGPDGAVHVFGPQKGVSADRLDAFEAGMARFADVVVRTAGADHRDAAGSGAAGGIGFLLRSFLDVEFRDGFSVIAEIAGLAERIAGADLVITGEGRIDAQSLVGKVPINVARLAQRAGVPAVALTGRIDGDLEAFREAGLAVVLPIVDRPMELAEAMADTPALVERAAARMMATLSLGAPLR